MSNIKSWSSTAASNTDATWGGMPEGMAPSAVNDNVRTQMAAHRTQWEDAEWFDWGHVPAYVSASTFTVSNSVTLVYAIGRRLKLGGIGSDYLYGHVTSISAVSGTNTKFTVSLTSGNLTSSLSTVAVSILDPTNTSIPKGAVLDAPTITAPTINTSVAGTAVAGKADLETPTSTAIIVPPAYVQNHPGVAKAWIKFNGSTSATAASHNASLTKNATGDYTITFATAFSSGDYVAVINHNQVLAGSQAVEVQSNTTTTYRFKTYYENPADNSQAVDPTAVMCVFFGDQ
jgi:hypothetical protein